MTGTDGPATAGAPALRVAGAPSAQQQLEAARELHAQGQRRAQLGRQLFEAAEVQALKHQWELDQIRTEQARLAEELRQDMARSFRQYDTWVGQAEIDFAGKLEELDRRLEAAQTRWAEQQERLEALLRGAETMVDQSRHLAEQALGEARQLTGIAAAALAQQAAAAGSGGGQTEASAPGGLPVQPPATPAGADQAMDERSTAVSPRAAAAEPAAGVYTGLVARLRGGRSPA